MRLGGCQCGAVRYGLDGAPLATFVCHCRECQKQSASAFGLSFIMPSAALTLLAGEPRFWSRPTDSGRRLRCAFCPACGSRVWHESVPPGATVSIKAGSLDEPIDLSDAIHIWTKRKLNGIVIPAGLQCHPEEPPD